MGKLKEKYFEEIAEGLNQAKDKFSDDDFQHEEFVRDYMVHVKHCGDTCKYGEDSICPVVIEKNQKIFELTGSYPF